MCGRYSNAKDLTELMKLVDAVMRLGFVPRYNIAPTQRVHLDTILER